MNFTEAPFLYFFVVVYASWWLLSGRPALRAALLIVSSLFFYAYHQPWLLAVILSYAVVDWAVALWIPRGGRLPLTVGLTFNLGVLCFWKYTPLVLHTVARLAFALDLPEPTVPTHWSIPLGISFFAFTGSAYLIDVYRGTITAEPSLQRFVLFKAFFPQLVAGPILRASDFLPALQPDTLPSRPEAPLEAALLIARGFFKKMVLADRIALAIDPFFSHMSTAATLDVWALPYVYLYAFQIYFDFSGYTDIARGLGLLFGFRWPENFRLPYLASSVQELWQRWHITLSQWLRDYLYIPLGGSRCGPWRMRFNLMLTMLLGGLWHGASWTFLLWGGLHGLYLVLHKAWTETRPRAWLNAQTGPIRWVWHAVAVGLTFHAVCLAWIFFRLTDLSQAWTCLVQCVRFSPELALVGGSADLSLWNLILAYGLFVAVWNLGQRLWSVECINAIRPIRTGAAWGLAVGGMLLAVLLTPVGQKMPFIYFQF